MAAITYTGNVIVLESSLEGTSSDKQRGRLDRLAITLASQGATLGDITAQILGFSEIYWIWSYNYVLNSTTLSQASVGLDNTVALLTNVATNGQQGYVPLPAGATYVAPQYGFQNIYTYTGGGTSPSNLTGVLYVEVFGRSL
jgi:hypothetical protein